MSIDKKKVIGILIVLAAIAVVTFISLPKNCDSDISCFDNSASKCSKAKVTTFKDDNQYMYNVLSKKKDNCLIEVRLLTLSETRPYDLKQALEGKSMTCSIPRVVLQSQTLAQISNLNDFCSGQLKEAILQITIDEMYSIIVKNIGPIAVEFRKNLA